MSPEQAEGKPVDHRSDIFSLGTILYEMATGKRPFQGDTSMSTIGAILKDEPSSVTEINPALPRHAGRILRRCLAKDPDRRYQTALDLRNELEELRAELSVTGTTDSRLPARRGWWPAIVVPAIAVIAVIAVAILDRHTTRRHGCARGPLRPPAGHRDGRVRQGHVLVSGRRVHRVLAHEGRKPRHLRPARGRHRGGRPGGGDPATRRTRAGRPTAATWPTSPRPSPGLPSSWCPPTEAPRES